MKRILAVGLLLFAFVILPMPALAETPITGSQNDTTSRGDDDEGAFDEDRGQANSKKPKKAVKNKKPKKLRNNLSPSRAQRKGSFSLQSAQKATEGAAFNFFSFSDTVDR